MPLPRSRKQNQEAGSAGVLNLTLRMVADSHPKDLLPVVQIVVYSTFAPVRTAATTTSASRREASPGQLTQPPSESPHNLSPSGARPPDLPAPPALPRSSKAGSLPGPALRKAACNTCVLTRSRSSSINSFISRSATRFFATALVERIPSTLVSTKLSALSRS